MNVNNEIQKCPTLPIREKEHIVIMKWEKKTYICCSDYNIPNKTKKKKTSNGQLKDPYGTINSNIKLVQSSNIFWNFDHIASSSHFQNTQETFHQNQMHK